MGSVLILVALGAFVLIPRGGASNASTTSATTPTSTTAQTTSAATPPAQQPRPSAKRATHSSPIVGTAAIEQALLRSPVVVVAAYQPSAVVDLETAAEAKAGAATAGVPFVDFDVANEQQARNLTSLLEGSQSPSALSLTSTTTLPATPAVLVFRRPRTLFVSFYGFVDRQIVAQAASLAEGRASGSAWQQQANAICRGSSDALGQLALQYSGSTNPATALAQIRGAVSVARQVLVRLRRVHPPAASAVAYQRAITLDAQVLTEAEGMLAALKKSDSDALLKAAARVTTVRSSASQAFVQLGLSDCA
ncbi:MAG: hypothetical protein ACXVZO_06305 [Gaiellaceae bacterium]